MSSRALAGRNFKVMWRDRVSLGVNLVLPLLMLLVLQALSDADDFFAPTSLAPGVVLFGFAMLTMTSALSLAQDRETSLFARMRTAPLDANGFVAAYSAPYLLVAAIQATIVFAVAAVLGMRIEGSVVWVVLVLGAMALLYVGVGMLIGATVSHRAVTGPWMVLLLLTIFGGTWVDLATIGGTFDTVASVFPFAHALDAVRSVMLDGAGLADIAGDLAWVVGWTAVVVAVSVAVFRRRLVD